MSRRPLTGPMLWHRRIAEADLKGSEKLVLFASLQWLEWRHTTLNTIHASVPTIARACGIAPKTVRRTLNGLRDLQVIEDRSKRKGGIGTNGRGIPNELAISMERLVELKRDDSTALDPENMDTEDAERGRSVPDTRSTGSGKADEMTTNQTSIQTTEQTTHQTTRADGGEGEASLMDRRKVAAQLLESRGVSLTKAKALASEHAPELIEAAVNQTDDSGRQRWPKPGLLVWAIEKGEATIERSRVEARTARERDDTVRRAEDAPRIEAINRLWNYLANDKTNRKRADEIGPLIQQAWPRVEQLAAARVLSDEELGGIGGREWVLLEKIAAHAERKQRARDARQNTNGESVALPQVLKYTVRSARPDTGNP